MIAKIEMDNCVLINMKDINKDVIIQNDSMRICKGKVDQFIVDDLFHLRDVIYFQ